MNPTKETNKNQQPEETVQVLIGVIISIILSLLRITVLRHSCKIAVDITAHTLENSLIEIAKKHGLSPEAAHWIEVALIVILWVILAKWVFAALKDLVEYILESLRSKKRAKNFSYFNTFVNKLKSIFTPPTTPPITPPTLPPVVSVPRIPPPIPNPTHESPPVIITVTNIPARFLSAGKQLNKNMVGAKPPVEQVLEPFVNSVSD